MSDVGQSRADRMIGNRPEVLHAWKQLEDSLVGETSLLDSELKEQVRRTLAQRTGCAYCASLGEPHAQHPDAAQGLAVAFAELVAENHHDVTSGQVAALFEEFNTGEVVELLVFICFEYAGQMLGALMGDEPATEAEREAFAAWVAERGRPASG
jgi:alkylhydroperoxidase family enzyme